MKILTQIILATLFLFSTLSWGVSIFSGDSAGIAIGFTLMAVFATGLSWVVD